MKCVNCNNCGGSYINSYHSGCRGSKLVLINEDNPVLYGIENELYFKSSVKDVCASKQIKDAFIRRKLECTVEWDGSVHNGFEVISQPMSFEIMKKHDFFTTFWDVRDWLRTTGTGAGMHIHMSHNHLTEVDIAKIIYFYSDINNKAFIEKINGRCATSYCEFGQYNNPINSAEQIKSGNYSGYRYQLNFNNIGRIEFRGFKSTVRPERVLKNVQYLRYLTFFVKNVDYIELTEKRFIEILMSTDISAYFELKSWLRLVDSVPVHIGDDTIRQLLMYEINQNK